ncbi:hypothetical protein ACTLMW_002158 [Enterobacter roggenkampii]
MTDVDNNKRDGSYYCIAILILIYTSAFGFSGVFLLFSGWISDFRFIFALVTNDIPKETRNSVFLCLYTISGALLGGATLSITSFHRNIVSYKCIGVDHIWGYVLAPLLSVIIGILVFCLIQGGLIVFTAGNYNNEKALVSMLGYVAFGAIGAYNWDVFIEKLQSLSKKIKEDVI